MNKLTQELREYHCFNAHNFAGHGNVFIEYHVQPSGRIGWTSAPSGWVVVRPGYRTDPEAGWLWNHNKPFTTSYYPSRAAALEAAKARAGKRYGITEWERTPYGTWMVKGFSKQRIAELRAKP